MAAPTQQEIDDANDRKNVFAEPAMVEAMCRAIPNATTPEALSSVFQAVCNITSDSGKPEDTNNRRNVFATPAMANAVVAALEHATTPSAVRTVFTAVFTMMSDAGCEADRGERAHILALPAIAIANAAEKNGPSVDELKQINDVRKWATAGLNMLTPD
jgi:hypothetical protein